MLSPFPTEDFRVFMKVNLTNVQFSQTTIWLQKSKSPAYRRHRISSRMQIVVRILFICRRQRGYQHFFFQQDFYSRTTIVGLLKQDYYSRNTVVGLLQQDYCSRTTTVGLLQQDFYRRSTTLGLLLDYGVGKEGQPMRGLELIM